jgi:hypothetical protein
VFRSEQSRAIIEWSQEGAFTPTAHLHCSGVESKSVIVEQVYQSITAQLAESKLRMD